jgi:hypothetical protein
MALKNLLCFLVVLRRKTKYDMSLELKLITGLLIPLFASDCLSPFTRTTPQIIYPHAQWKDSLFFIAVNKDLVEYL